MLIASKKAITRRWMKNVAPEVEDWIEVIHNNYVMEKLTFSVRLEVDKFKRIWENLIGYIKPIRPNFLKSISWLGAN